MNNFNINDKYFILKTELKKEISKEMIELKEIFDIVNGNFILKDDVRTKLVSILLDTYEPGKGNGKFHSVMYLRSISDIGIKLAHDIVDSINTKKI
jgi:hypothetical protein